MKRRKRFYDSTSRLLFEMRNARFLKDVDFGKEESIRNVVFEEEFVVNGERVPNIVRDNNPEQDNKEVLHQVPIE
ncbi:hypothetical protein Lal_00021807 [Lupinus albus]|nr:hypothetical protein Lal_00021807 [Lupinus albus]